MNTSSAPSYASVLASLPPPSPRPPRSPPPPPPSRPSAPSTPRTQPTQLSANLSPPSPAYLRDRQQPAQDQGFYYEPPVDRYDSKDELKADVQSQAKENGFAVVWGRTRPAKGTADLTCEMYSTTRVGDALKQHPDSRQRTYRSIRCKCPWKLRCYLEEDEDLWSFRLASSTFHHNHRPMPSEAFAQHRQPPLAVRERVEQLTILNKEPREIVALLKAEFNTVKVTREDVRAIRRRFLHDHGTSDVQGVLDIVRQAPHAGEIAKALITTYGTLAGVFYSTKHSRALSRRYPSSFALDATYKTTVYKMPVLQIVGITATGQSFTSCVVIVSNEKFPWYQRAIELWRDFLGDVVPKTVITDRDANLRRVLYEVFPMTPRLLCIYHLRNNVISQRGIISDAEAKDYAARWVQAACSWTLPELQDARAALNNDFGDRPDFDKIHKYASALLDDPALSKLFLVACTKVYRTLGVKATTRAEAKHHLLKERLHKSSGSLTYLVRTLREVLEQEWIEITTQLAKDMAENGLKYPAVLRALAGVVSTAALKELAEQFRLLRVYGDSPSPRPCSEGFEKVYGLPCWHKMKVILEGRALGLEDVHVHWHLDMPVDLARYGNLALNLVPSSGPRNGAIVGDDAEQVCHFNHVSEPVVPVRVPVKYRGVVYTDEQVTVVPQAMASRDRRPAQGAGARGGTQSTQRDPIHIENLAEADEQRARDTRREARREQLARERRARPFCPICKRHVNHRDALCPREKQREKEKQRRAEKRAAARKTATPEIEIEGVAEGDAETVVSDAETYYTTMPETPVVIDLTAS